MNKYTLVLDSSQLVSFLECQKRWDNYYNKKLEPLGMKPEEEAMNAGTYGHKLLDIYYRLRFRGTGLNSVIEQVLSYDPDKDTCECGCSSELHTSSECTRCKKCPAFRPHPLELSLKARNVVRNRFRDYVFNYQHNDIMPLSEQHVEVGFSEPIYEDDENLFVLEGRIDLIGKMQGLDCIMDHKFQNQTHWLYNKSIQFKNYMLIAKAPMAVVNYIRLHEKMQPGITLTREIISLNRVEQEAWHKRLIELFFKVKLAQTSELEKNWSHCSGNYLTYDREKPRYCWYRDLCEEPSTKIAERKEKELFKIKEAQWRPW